MDVKQVLRKRFVESPESLGARARSKRAEQFLEVFPSLAEMKVLDLGGTRSFWERLPQRPAHVTTLNVVTGNLEPADWHVDLAGDACDPPAAVAGSTYDLVFSNSTIEHVGDRQRRRLFADVVRGLSSNHWVQTPNRYFPLEPHVLFPFEQFLPRYGKAMVHRYWPLVHTNSSSLAAGLKAADRTELITRAELQEIFPQSRLEEERILPIGPAKSLIAIHVDLESSTTT